MSSRISKSNMVQLLFFLYLSNCKSLNGRCIKNMELTIGTNMKKIVIESIGKEEGNLRVGITISFAMGGKKISSDNHYDLLSIHVLMIECLSKKYYCRYRIE